ncbi:hypothetical protein Tco_0016510 [Tanacetum coccineum]
MAKGSSGNFSTNSGNLTTSSGKTLSSGNFTCSTVVESLQAVETLQWENILTVGSSSNSGNHSTNSGNPLVFYSQQPMEMQELSNQLKELQDKGKANIVADALSRKEWIKPRRARAMSMTIHFSIKARILKAQSEASKDINMLAEMLRGLDKQFERKDDSGLYFME